MLNFDDFQKGLMEAEECEEYLEKFFTKENYKNYEADPYLDKDEKYALKVLFTSKDDVIVRIEDALDIDAFCKEAFYAYMSVTDDMFLSHRFETYYKQVGNITDMTPHQRGIFVMILDFYAQFLTDIGNITKAIKVWNTRYKLTKDSGVVDELCELYFQIENADDFYRLYLYEDFDLKQYLLLIVTLLKHEDQNRAMEVVNDMSENIAYTEYLDRLFDLDLNDPYQKYVYDTVEAMYDEISSVPELFSFISRVKD